MGSLEKKLTEIGDDKGSDSESAVRSIGTITSLLEWFDRVREGPAHSSSRNSITRSSSADVSLTVIVDRADERFRLLFNGPICKLESASGVFTALVSGVSWLVGSPLKEDAEDVRKDVREEVRRIRSDVPTNLGSIF